MKIILASGSPRRKELLEQIGITFEVVTSYADENIDETDPEEMVKALSKKKAEAVYDEIVKRNAENVTKEQSAETYAVIGADTIVYHRGQVYGKPESWEAAADMLESLAGAVHQVYTGVTVLCTDGKQVSFAEKTDVAVYPMTREEIHTYVETGDSMDKAGAYGIQGPFAAFVQGIQGDYNNVVGLPVARLYQELKGLQ